MHMSCSTCTSTHWSWRRRFKARDEASKDKTPQGWDGLLPKILFGWNKRKVIGGRFARREQFSSLTEAVWVSHHLRGGRAAGACCVRSYLDRVAFAKIIRSWCHRLKETALQRLLTSSSLLRALLTARLDRIEGRCSPAIIVIHVILSYHFQRSIHNIMGYTEREPTMGIRM